MPNNNGKKAFTLIELLIVITILGILTGVSVPQLRKTADNFQLDNFVKDTYYLCRYLESSSISEGRIYCLNVNPSEKWLKTSYKDSDGTFKPAAGKSARARKVPEGISIVTSSDITEIYFYPDGSISGITLAFKNNHNHKASLTTSGTTGAIKIE